MRATPIRSSRPSIVARLAGAVAVVEHLHRERLAGDVLLVRARRVEQLVVAAERQRDAVLDREARGLARVLDRVDDLAREALAPQLVVERQVERHRVRALALELVALERRECEQQVVGAQLVLGAVDVDADRPAVAQRRGDAGRRRAPRPPPATCGIALPKRGPERAVVGLDLVGAELVGARRRSAAP